MYEREREEIMGGRGRERGRREGVERVRESVRGGERKTKRRGIKRV
jgi:hypothetical protein